MLVKHDEAWQHRPSGQIERPGVLWNLELGGISHGMNSAALDYQRLVLSGWRARAIDDPHVSQATRDSSRSSGIASSIALGVCATAVTAAASAKRPGAGRNLASASRGPLLRTEGHSHSPIVGSHSPWRGPCRSFASTETHGAMQRTFLDAPDPVSRSTLRKSRALVGETCEIGK